MPNEKIFNNIGDLQEDTLSSAWFQVDMKNVKHKEVPTTGEEFLVSVITERRNIDTVTKCDIDYNKYNKNQSCFAEEVPVAAAPDTLKPTIEWQNIQVADFSEVRMYISRMLNQPPEKRKKIKNIHMRKSDVPWWKHFLERNEPVLSCVLRFNQSQLDIGFEMLTAIIKETPPGETIDYKMGKWIYAFLACRRQPLISDTISIMRDLARCCAEIRSKINPSADNAQEMALPLNLIICIIGRYFSQFDLADARELEV